METKTWRTKLSYLTSPINFYWKLIYFRIELTVNLIVGVSFVRMVKAIIKKCSFRKNVIPINSRFGRKKWKSNLCFCFWKTIRAFGEKFNPKKSIILSHLPIIDFVINSWTWMWTLLSSKMFKIVIIKN